MNTNNRYHFVLFLLMILVGFGCADGYKQGNPQKLGESFYLALKNNDPEGYRTLMLQENDFEASMEIAEDLDGKSEEAYRMQFDWSMRSLDEEVASGFPKLREKVVSEGGDWANLEYKGVDVEKKDDENGFQIARIRVYFSSNGKEFELDGKDCANLNGKWVGGDMGKIHVVN